jgi:hypothetical protein
MSQTPTAWYLTIHKGPKAGKAYPLPASVITIGRHSDNSIVIDDAMISRRHARLTWQGNNFILEDLNSANGTWVNNVRITGPAVLRAGDVVGLSQDILLVFGKQPEPDETVFRSPARPAATALPAVVPPAPVMAPPPAQASRGWLLFGMGGLMAAIGLLAVVIVGVAIYLLLKPATPASPTGPQAVVPTTAANPTATPYPTYTPYPTPAPTLTPYPTYTPYPTPAPTATPYPTYTPYPTPASTATPYPTYTPYPTLRPVVVVVQPTNAPTDAAPAPTATPQAPYTVTLGRNVIYEPWGRPTDPGGCKGPYDDKHGVIRRFTVEVILTNNSNRFTQDKWFPTFISASGRPLVPCIWYYNNTVVEPGESADVTFATHLEANDWVRAMVFDELNYTVTICLNGAAQQVPCQ